jgi:hypothetical protein
MHKGSLVSQPQVAVRIVRYLLNHPDAKDTAEGIARWWLSWMQVVESRGRTLIYGLARMTGDQRNELEAYAHGGKDNAA